MAELKTRIALRNANSAAWNASDVENQGSKLVLLKGEIGIELCDDGSKKIKIGDGLTPWGELAYANKTPDEIDTLVQEAKDAADAAAAAAAEAETNAKAYAAQLVEGLDIPTGGAVYQVSSLDEIEDTPANGDMAIVSTVINGDKVSRTAFVFNDTLNDGTGDWVAFDGNYDASNVYFSENVTVTTTVGNISTSNNTPKELAFAGKNLKQIYEYLYAKEDTYIDGVTAASASISLDTSAPTKEVGDTYTMPKAKVTVSYGKYGDYGGINATGAKKGKSDNIDDITFDLVLKYKAPGATSAVQIASVDDGTSIDYTAVPEDNQPESLVVTDADITHTFSGTYAHTASGYKPITNLGNFVTSIKSTSATSTNVYADGALGIPEKASTNMSNKSFTVKGYRPWFVYTGSDLGAVDAAYLRSDKITNKGTGKSLSFSDSAPLGITVAAGTKRVLIAIPTGKLTGTETTIGNYTARVKKCIDVDGMGLDIYAAKSITELTVSLPDLSGENAMDYVVYLYDNSNGWSATTLNFSIN